MTSIYPWRLVSAFCWYAASHSNVDATVHCTSNLERAFGVSARRANYNATRMLNAVPFLRSTLATSTSKDSRDFTIQRLRNTRVYQARRKGRVGDSWRNLLTYRAPHAISICARYYRDNIIDEFLRPAARLTFLSCYVIKRVAVWCMIKR